MKDLKPIDPMPQRAASMLGGWLDELLAQCQVANVGRLQERREGRRGFWTGKHEALLNTINRIQFIRKHSNLI